MGDTGAQRGEARRETHLELGAQIALTSARTRRTSRCTIGELIGVGGTAKVYAGTLNDGAQVVVKAQRWADASDAAFAREILISRQALHRNVVHCVGGGVLPRGELALAFRRAYANPLNLIQAERLPLDVAIDLSFELLNALEYLERIQVAHHDLKVSNLLIDVGPAERVLAPHEVLERVARRDYRAVLIDFGAARFFEEMGPWRQGDVHPDGLTPQLTPLCAPPEAVIETRGPGGRLARTFHPTLDRYSAALLIHSLITGRQPYSHLPQAPDAADLEGVVELKSAERRGSLQPVTGAVLADLDLVDTRFQGTDRGSFQRELVRFLQRRLHPDPKRRGTAAEMKRDFARLMRIRPLRRRPDEQRPRVRLPFTQDLVRVGARGRACLRPSPGRARATRRVSDPATEDWTLAPRPTTRRVRPAAARGGSLRPDLAKTNPSSDLDLTPVAAFPTGAGALRGPVDPAERGYPVASRANQPHCLVSAVLDEPVLLGREEPLVIGRNSFADVRIRSDRVSRRHASITWDGKGFVLVDLGSVNGTRLNGYPVKQRVALHEDDRISFGGFEFVVRVIGSDCGADWEYDSGERTRAFGESGHAAVRPDLVGTLGELELMAVIELLDWKRHSGTLTITADQGRGDSGHLYLREGKIVNAEGRGARGVEAALRLLAVETGRFAFEHGSPECAHVIDCASDELWSKVRERKRDER